MRKFSIALTLSLSLVACKNVEGGGDKADSADASKADGDEGKALQDKPEPEKPTLPKAESLLDKAVVSAGGAEAFAKIHSYNYEGQLVVVGQKLEARAKVWWKDGDFYTEQDMLGVGQVRAGKLGDAIWSEDPINGLRQLSGLEAEQVTWQSSLMLAADWKRYFDKAETVEQRVEGETSIYVVRLTSASGAEIELHLDADSGLQRGLAFVQATPMGEIPVTLKMEGYRDFEGVKLAFLQVTEMPLASATLEIQDLQLNPEISTARFQMPRADADVVRRPE